MIFDPPPFSFICIVFTFPLPRLLSSLFFTPSQLDPVTLAVSVS